MVCFGHVPDWLNQWLFVTIPTVLQNQSCHKSVALTQIIGLDTSQ